MTNKQPSRPPHSHALVALHSLSSSPLLPPPITPLLSLPSYRPPLLSPPSLPPQLRLHSLSDVFFFFSFSSFSLSHSLCPRGIQLSAPADAGPVQTHTNGCVTKTRLDTGNRQEEEREVEEEWGGGRLLLCSSDRAKLRETKRRHGRRSLGRSVRLTRP